MSTVQQIRSNEFDPFMQPEHAQSAPRSGRTAAPIEDAETLPASKATAKRGTSGVKVAMIALAILGVLAVALFGGRKAPVPPPAAIAKIMETASRPAAAPATTAGPVPAVVLPVTADAENSTQAATAAMPTTNTPVAGSTQITAETQAATGETMGNTDTASAEPPTAPVAVAPVPRHTLRAVLTDGAVIADEAGELRVVRVGDQL